MKDKDGDVGITLVMGDCHIITIITLKTPITNTSFVKECVPSPVRSQFTYALFRAIISPTTIPKVKPAVNLGISLLSRRSTPTVKQLNSA